MSNFEWVTRPLTEGDFKLIESMNRPYACLQDRVVTTLPAHKDEAMDLEAFKAYEHGLHNHYCAGCRREIVRRCDCLQPLIADWCSADCHRLGEL